MEDSKSDLLLIRQAIESAGVSATLHIAADGEKAVRFFDAADADDTAPCPMLILLDLNLPKKHGCEVLRHIRSSRKCAHTPVLIVTSSDSPGERRETAALGATDYFCKPSDYDSFLQLGEIVRHMLDAIVLQDSGVRANGTE